MNANRDGMSLNKESFGKILRHLVFYMYCFAFAVVVHFGSFVRSEKDIVCSFPVLPTMNGLKKERKHITGDVTKSGTYSQFKT